MPHHQTATAQPTASATDASTASPRDARAWRVILDRYRDPSRARSVTELTVTIVPLVALWALAVWALQLGWWLALPIAVPAGGFLVRLFMIQHDCGHGAFFANRSANDWVGRAIGVLTLTPYDFWRRTHAIHHASSGNLDRRGIGDIDTLTVDEYLARSPWGRFKYRLYRHPLVMFVAGPTYLFVLQHRLPLGLMRAGAMPWISTMATNAAIALLVAVVIWFVGLKALLLVHLPMTLVAGAAGVWLFYVQHQFEHTVWRKEPAWNVHDAALHGSSYYALPAVLQWMTANIGIHHVHHLASRIPYYRLSRVIADHPELGRIGRLTVGGSLRCVRLTLWDEARQRLISFRDLRAPRPRG